MQATSKVVLMFRQRWYQRRATNKTIESIEKGNNPCTVLPTGSGKTIVICCIVEKYLDRYIENDVLILSHRKKILQQDHSALCRHFPDLVIGLYSAGLKSKIKCKITVAGIQSVFNAPDLFSNVGLIIIDEAHLINHKCNGMYRDFISKLAAQCVGLTATPFRLTHGYIYKGEDALFNDLAYDLSSTENYNKLVGQGYLSPMYSRSTKFIFDTTNVKKRGGDFDQKSSKEAFDREAITSVACNEIVREGRKNGLKKWLIFAIDIEHAEHIKETIAELGISCECLHSRVDDQDEALDGFRSGLHQCLVGVDMPTTGLDIPEIDLIGVLRPTESPALHVQMLGRGGRPAYAEGYDLSKRRERIKSIKKGVKPFCLVLDFAGNVNRLGPINSVKIEENYTKKKREGGGEPITKICPKCNTIAYGSCRICDCCGHKFIFKQKIISESSDSNIILSSPEENKNDRWEDIESVCYSVHSVAGKTSSMKVEYLLKNRERVTEYVCIDHGGYARHLAKHWIRARLKHGTASPRNLSQLIRMKRELRIPKSIMLIKNGKWNNVKECRF